MVCDPLWPLVAQRLKRIEEFQQVQRLVVAVSGGPDSIALLHVLQTHALKRFPKLSLVVAHLNHGLRGTAADEDALYVQEFCSQLDVPCVIDRIDVSVYAQAEKKNWEATARHLRYGFLHRVAVSVRAQTVATGHTMTDQAETVLLRLLRGTSPDGLSAIQAVRRITSPKETGDSVQVIRPLIDVERSEVEAYLKRHQVPARYDATNTDLQFTRNRLRLEVWPLLKAINPQVAKTLACTANQAQEDAAYFAEITAQWLKAHTRQTDEGMWFPVPELVQLPAALKNRVLHRAIQQEQFPAITHYHIQQLSEVLLSAGSDGKIITLPGKRRVRRTGNFLLLERVTVTAK